MATPAPSQPNPPVSTAVCVGIICWSLMGAADVGNKCYVSALDAYWMSHDKKGKCTD